MIDPEAEELLPLKAICDMFPGRSGRGVSLSTVWRWVLVGRRGCRLDSLIVGGTRYTSKAAVRLFVEALNSGDPSAGKDDSRRNTDDAIRVSAELEAEGI